MCVMCEYTVFHVKTGRLGQPITKIEARNERNESEQREREQQKNTRRNIRYINRPAENHKSIHDLGLSCLSFPLSMG